MQAVMGGDGSHINSPCPGAAALSGSALGGSPAQRGRERAPPHGATAAVCEVSPSYATCTARPESDFRRFVGFIQRASLAGATGREERSACSSITPSVRLLCCLQASFNSACCTWDICTTMCNAKTRLHSKLTKPLFLVLAQSALSYFDNQATCQ
ncbi:hypothetical protein DV515_00008457, partial [Chloebia gouldiae]